MTSWPKIPNDNPYCFYIHLPPLSEKVIKNEQKKDDNKEAQKFFKNNPKFSISTADSLDKDSVSYIFLQNAKGDDTFAISNTDFFQQNGASDVWDKFVKDKREVSVVQKTDSFDWETVIKLVVRMKDETADRVLFKSDFARCEEANKAWVDFVERKFPKRDVLRSYEKRIAQYWEDNKLFELDAVEGEPKWIGTFPYPYMNGALHMGHAFTTCKVDFTAAYQRLKGKRALFPFGFHCTGMPIKACADKLKREIKEFGNPPQFPTEEKQEASSSGKPQKSKVQAKSVGAKYQWQIMRSSGVPESEIASFADENHWLEYFPPRAMTDLKSLGTKVDWRRSFITTDVNKYYDAFIRWQFNKLKKLGKVIYGTKRPTIYSPLDGQACLDHERQEGETVGIADYTIVKQELLKPYPEPLKQFESSELKFFLAPATLRPETMYGQTNCWILPTGDYGAYQINDKEVFICTYRAARNMAFQDNSSEYGKVVELAKFKGSTLIGAKIKAPLSKYEVVHVLPMTTVSCEKSTGVVTSVPSDSPDDYVSFRELKNKPEWRAQYGIKDEMILPFEVVPIIKIPDLGDLAAVNVVEEMKINGPKDPNLAAAKDKVYSKGFYHGVMTVGDHAGKLVSEAKPLIKNELIKQGLAVEYREPDGLVISRSGDVCVVALVDQWYLNYGEPTWQKQAFECLDSMDTYQKETANQFREALKWIHEWACSRSYGLGSRIPWDKQFLIESLSDSTIYNAYYSISYLLQGGVIDGSKQGPANINAEDLTDEVLEYVFGESELPKTTIPTETLEKMRREFRVWYPVDLRCSGKDLIPNHLTFYIYNHIALFPKEKWPKGIKANGHLLLNGEKMAKRTGNFITLKDAIERYSADGIRFAFAQAGDTVTDPNFTQENLDTGILHLHTFIDWVKEMKDTKATMRTGAPTTLWENIFAAEIQKCCRLTDKHYDRLLFRDVVNVGFFEMQKARDDYRKAVLSTPGDVMNWDLVIKFVKSILIMMAPIVSYTSEYIWREILEEKGSVFNARFPNYTDADESILHAKNYMSASINTFRAKIIQHTKPPKKGNVQGKPHPKSARIYVTPNYPDWHKKTLEVLQEIYAKNNNKFPDNKTISESIKNIPELKTQMKKVMPKISDLTQKANSPEGITNEDFAMTLPFDEKKILLDTLEYQKVELKLEKLDIHLTTDKDLPENEATISTGEPGKPLIFFD